MLVAETEKYAVELSTEPHMPAGPFLVGGNTGFHPFGLLYIILNFFFCFFFPSLLFSNWKYKSRGIREVDKTKLSEKRGC